MRPQRAPQNLSSKADRRKLREVKLACARESPGGNGEVPVVMQRKIADRANDRNRHRPHPQQNGDLQQIADARTELHPTSVVDRKSRTARSAGPHPALRATLSRIAGEGSRDPSPRVRGESAAERRMRGKRPHSEGLQSIPDE